MSNLFTLLKALTWGATFAAMFGGAVRVGPGSLRRVRDRAGLFARTLFAVWILVPVLTILVVLALDVRGLSATMLLLMAVCPGLPTLLGLTGSVRGSLTTALLALLLTAATEPLVIPWWTRILSVFHPLDLRVSATHVLAVLLPTVFLPVLLGFAMRAVWPRLATRLARLCDFLYMLGLVSAAVVVLAQGAGLLRHVPLRAFAAALAITLGDALIGYWVARPDVEDQMAISLAVALGNPALAIAVVEVSYPDHLASELVAVYLIVRAIAILPFELWLKRLGRLKRLKKAPAVRRSIHGQASRA